MCPWRMKCVRGVRGVSMVYEVAVEYELYHHV